MPLTILTYFIQKFKLMAKLINLPKWIGPMLTLIAIAMNQQAIQLGLFPPQVAWLYVPVAFSAVSGLRAGLVSAVLVALYSVWLDPSSIQRIVIVPLSVFALAALVGWQTRALRVALAEARAEHLRADSNQDARKIVDTLNGNIVRIIEAREMIESILLLDFLTEGTRAKLGAVLHTLRNLQMATKGWQELAEIRKQQGP